MRARVRVKVDGESEGEGKVKSAFFIMTDTASTVTQVVLRDVEDCPCP